MVVSRIAKEKTMYFVRLVTVTFILVNANPVSAGEYDTDGHPISGTGKHCLVNVHGQIRCKLLSAVV